MLAGDVDVFVRHGDLIIRGDNEANQVEVRADSAGVISVVGLSGTTINGGDTPFVASEDGEIADDVRVWLRGGDDTILFDGLEIHDDLTVYGGRGDDAIGLLRTNVGDDARIYGQRDELKFSLDLSTIGDDLYVAGSRDDDTLVIDDSTVGDDTTLVTSRGDDTIVVRDSVHRDDVRLFTGSGDDFVAVIGTEIGDDVFAYLGRGDDNLLIQDSTLGDRVYAFGGWGEDALELAGENTLNERRTPRLRSFEEDSVGDANAVVDQAIADLVDAGARRPTLVDIATGNDDFSTLVSLLVQAGLVDAVSGDDPLTVFAPNNAAFESFVNEFSLTVNEDGTLDVPAELLQSVLTFHVSAGNVDAVAVVGSESIATLQGETISVDVNESGVTLDSRAGLVLTDVRARNGIIHVIDTVLTPAELDSAVS